MQQRTADVQRDIAVTRERMSETIAELDARITDRVAVVKDRLDLRQLIEDYPWPALAVALGLGVLLGATGADAKAARATARAAKGAPGTTADLARRGWSAAAGAMRRDGRDNSEDDHGVHSERGLAASVRSAITRATGVDQLMTQMRDAATELGRPASYAGRSVPQNTGQQM